MKTTKDRVHLLGFNVIYGMKLHQRETCVEN